MRDGVMSDCSSAHELPRLVHSHDAMRDELAAEREAASRRETELQRQIQTLQQALSTSATSLEHSVTLHAVPQSLIADENKLPQAPEPVEWPQSGPLGVLNEDELEKSMDLATPLQPTILLQGEPSLHQEAVTTHTAAPGSPSPPASISPPSSPHDGSPIPITESGSAAERLRLVEEELALARQELEERDDAIHDLRGFVEELRDMVETGTEPEPHEDDAERNDDRG